MQIETGEERFTPYRESIIWKKSYIDRYRVLKYKLKFWMKNTS